MPVVTWRLCLQAFNFMFYPDFSKLTVNGVLIALGTCLFYPQSGVWSHDDLWRLFTQ